jgi:hypothetical protein
MKIDRRLVRVAKVYPMREGNQLSNATGFFYLENGYLYLITAGHVVSDPKSDHYPDQLRVVVHANADNLTQDGQLMLNLYNSQGYSIWRQHPQLGYKADVVAVPIFDAGVIANWYVDTFGPDDLVDETRSLPLGQQVHVVGFPLGFEDTVHHLPLVRNATIASVYPLPFKGERYFVTDARLHRGASGSPVVAHLVEPDGRTVLKLLGVHAASLDVSNRDPAVDEPLGLNMAWYASLIPEMTGTG